MESMNTGGLPEKEKESRLGIRKNYESIFDEAKQKALEAKDSATNENNAARFLIAQDKFKKIVRERLCALPDVDPERHAEYIDHITEVLADFFKKFNPL